MAQGTKAENWLMGRPVLDRISARICEEILGSDPKTGEMNFMVEAISDLLEDELHFADMSAQISAMNEIVTSDEFKGDTLFDLARLLDVTKYLVDLAKDVNSGQQRLDL